MVYLVENGVPAQIGELCRVASGTVKAVAELYSAAGGAAALVYASGYAVTIMGAPGETVSYSGPDSGTLTLDANGDGEAVLRRGSYTLTGSVSGTRSNASVTHDGPLTLWPEGARILYWHGRYGLLDDGVTAQSLVARDISGSYSAGGFTLNAHSVSLVAQSRYYQSQSTGAICLHFQPISYTGHTQLKYIVSRRQGSSYGTQKSTLGQKSAVDTNECPNSFSADGTYTYPIDPTLAYVCADAQNESEYEASYSSIQFDLNAVYLA